MTPRTVNALRVTAVLLLGALAAAVLLSAAPAPRSAARFRVIGRYTIEEGYNTVRVVAVPEVGLCVVVNSQHGTSVACDFRPEGAQLP